jgi:hypothetical protein
MSDMLEVEVWVAVDENGDYAVGNDNDVCQERYAEDVGGGGLATRLVKVVLSIPRPQPVVLRGVVPAEVCDGELSLS